METRAFVVDETVILEGYEAVGESDGNPKREAVLAAQLFADPLAKGGGTFAEVYCDIEHGATYAAYQFTHTAGIELIVHAAHGAFAREADIVLHKILAETGVGPHFL